VADRLVGLEIWDELECNSGSKLADLPLPFSVVEDADINADHRVVMALDRTDASWAFVDFEDVLRATFADGEVSEWRIREIEQARGSDNARLAIVAADHIKYDLIHNSGLLERVEKDGSVWNHFEYYGKSPTAHATTSLSEAPGYFTLGSIADNERVDMIYHQDNPLSALEELASVTGLELEVVRNGATDYLVRLVKQRGGTATPITIEHAQNLISQSRTQRSDDMGTQIYPRGGQQYGDEGSMANHAHLVGSVSGTTVEFVNELFSEDDQLNGLYVEDSSGSIIQITDTIAPRTIVLASSPSVTGERRLRFKRQFTDPVSGVTYGALTFLPSPSAIDQYKTKPALLDRSDIPLIDNLLPDPMLNEWSGGIPRYWQTVGSPVTRRNVDPLYTRHGDASLYVRAGFPGEGVETIPFYVKPTEEQPFFVAQIQIYVVSGHVRLELEDVTNGEVFPPVGKDAATVATGVWINSFGVAPGGTPDDNFFESTVEGKVTTQQFKIRVTQIGEEAAEWYLDMGQVTQTPTFRQVMYGGRASNDLWLLAREALEYMRTPSAEYDVELVDFNRLDPVTYSASEVVLGGPITLLDADLDLNFSTRILTYRKNWLVEGDTQITVEGKTHDLARILGETERRIRRRLTGPYGEEGTTTGVDLDQEEDDTGGEDDDSINTNNEEDCRAAEEEYCTEDTAGDVQLEPWEDIVLVEPVADDGPTETEWDGLDLAWSAEGYVTVTDPDAEDFGEVNAEGTIKKTGTGLLLRDPLSSLSNFDIEGTVAIETIDGLPWMMVGPASTVKLKTSVMSPRSKMRAQVYHRRAAYPAGSTELIALAHGAATYSTIAGYSMRKRSDDAGLFRVVGGASDIPLQTGSADGGSGSFIKNYLSVGVEPSDQWAGHSGNPSYAAADTFYNGQVGTVAFRNLNTLSLKASWYRDLYVTDGEPLVMTGLSAGYKIQWGGQIATEDGSGRAEILRDPGNVLHGGGGLLEVLDGSNVVQAEISPASGVHDGDTFIYDPAGTLTGESDFDSQVVVDLEFYTIDYSNYPAWTLISVAHGEPTRNSEYSAQSIIGQTTIPAGTMMIRPVMRREGGAQAIACVRRLIITVGTKIPSWKPCDLKFLETGGFVGEARIPTDEGLLVHLPFDDFKYPKGDHSTGSFGYFQCVADPDGSIALSRTEFDASVNRNHFALSTRRHQVGAVDTGSGAYRDGYRNGWMPEKGVSGWGRVIPDWFEYGISWPAIYFASELDRANEPSALDVWEGFTVSFWLKPFINSWAGNAICGLYDDFNGITNYQGLNYPREQGGWQIWWDYGWDRLGHLRFRWRSPDPSGNWATGDTIEQSVRWNADPAFGSIDTDSVPPGKARDVGDLCDQFAFCCIKVSPKYSGSTPEGIWSGGAWQPYTGDLMDVTAYYGNSLTGFFKKLTDADVYDYAFATGPRTTSKGMPAVEGFSNRGSNPNNNVHFTFAGAQANNQMLDHCEYWWDPSMGVFDEFRMYERVLSDGEAYGLFMLGCGSQPHTQACDQIYDNIVGAGAANAAAQGDCGGADPFAQLFGINNLI